ncbi:MAG: hypothetical protein ACFFCP_11900 [Promethearchaeota archaeon]
MDLSNLLSIFSNGIQDKVLRSERVSTLQQILSEEFGENAQLESVERLRSRKNIVLHLKLGTMSPTDVVAKLFVVDKFDIELQILKTSWEKSLSVPEVINAKNGVILMNFLAGDLFVDILNHTFKIEYVDLLADWYHRFHSAHGMIKGDPRLRNFLCLNDILYGVDFEECRLADWMLDIGGIAASFLDTDPIFDVRKRRLCWRLLEQYLALNGKSRTNKIDQEFIETVAESLNQTSIRRNSEAISSLAQDVRRNGIPTD